MVSFLNNKMFMHVYACLVRDFLVHVQLLVFYVIPEIIFIF